MSKSIIKNIKDNLDKEYHIFNCGISKKEKNILEHFNVEKTDQYSNFDNLDSLVNDLKIFLESVGNNKSQHVIIIINLILKIMKNVLEGYSKPACWFTIRVSLPTDAFKIPRWHTDGKYFGNYDKQSKFILTLKGEGTLLADCDKETRNKLFEIKNKFPIDKKQSEEDRITRNEIIKENIKENKCDIKQVPNYKGIIITVGNREKSALHSEPDITETRIFISILPGSKEEILELKKFWKK